MAELSPLRRRMIEDMTVRNLSPATQRSCINAVQKFSRYFGRSPDQLDLEDFHAFQVHLVATGISWASLNQIVCALRFFYGITLGQNDVPERIPYGRKPRTLPVVLSADEVVQFLEAVSSLKARVALTCAYAAGLRVGEVCGLKVEDIDSYRMVIHVRQALAHPCAMRIQIAATTLFTLGGQPAAWIHDYTPKTVVTTFEFKSEQPL